MVVGDLNELTDELEKLGGREIWKIPLFFKTFMLETGGIDLGH